MYLSLLFARADTYTYIHTSVYQKVIVKGTGSPCARPFQDRCPHRSGACKVPEDVQEKEEEAEEEETRRGAEEGNVKRPCVESRRRHCSSKLVGWRLGGRRQFWLNYDAKPREIDAKSRAVNTRVLALRRRREINVAPSFGCV